MPAWAGEKARANASLLSLGIAHHEPQTHGRVAPRWVYPNPEGLRARRQFFAGGDLRAALEPAHHRKYLFFGQKVVAVPAHSLKIRCIHGQKLRGSKLRAEVGIRV